MRENFTNQISVRFSWLLAGCWLVVGWLWVVIGWLWVAVGWFWVAVGGCWLVVGGCVFYYIPKNNSQNQESCYTLY